MNLSELRTRLLCRRNTILRRAQDDLPMLESSAEPADGLGMEVDDLDVLFRIDLSERRELNRINNALERMEIGSYGTCRVCGGKIDHSRLQSEPYAETCRRCAAGEARSGV